MDENITKDEVVEEETTEETTPEEDVEETSTEGEEPEEEDIDWKAEAEKEKAARLKAERAIEKSKKKGKVSEKTEPNDEVIIARLEARGVLNSEDQEYIMRVAKLEDMHYLEALDDPVVQDRLAANKKKRESVAATPRNNNRAPNTANELDRAVAKFQKDGTLPDNPALVAKILDKVK